MIYEVTFTKRANSTFISVQDQLFDKWGQRTLSKFEKRTEKVLKTLSHSPFSYQALEDNPNIRKAYIHKNCSLFYKVRDNKVAILFFWDNRQDPIL
ncbi:type II toxin-antitoxin system RelE/ParE family toxin [Mucilaginibacter pedocola]|uniref:Plasmid stabilization protein n=1 Tax=Mucilaginibacter pedocola TaxID=1792845 RepID=A0A1S9PH39_9SPHI|nr:hypothetical protein [Mucilaginibacter pedocola]OOQ60219.1 hypothetical protein BC343_26030 [Mucilaginibacter pedocola]